MSSYNELIQIANTLNEQANLGIDPETRRPLESLGKALEQAKKAFSGSWLGYHACVYYHDLKSPPPNAHFSSEWGLKNRASGLGSKGSWEQYTQEEIKEIIYKNANNPNLDILNNIAKKSEELFEESKSDALSILSSELNTKNDDFLKTIKTEIENLEFIDRNAILQLMKPNNEIITRDAIAAGQGLMAPPHVKIEAELTELHNSTALLNELEAKSRRAAKHILRQKRNDKVSAPLNEHGGFKDLLHPLIIEHASALYESGNYREAVLNSIIAIYDSIRERTGIEADGDKLVGQAFSIENPLLILSELETDSGRNDQKGFMQIFKGAYQGIRNPKAHTLSHDLDATKAAQYLVFASLLIRRVEESVLVPQP